jgi:hypothetical protein
MDEGDEKSSLSHNSGQIQQRYTQLDMDQLTIELSERQKKILVTSNNSKLSRNEKIFVSNMIRCDSESIDSVLMNSGNTQQ